LAITSAFQADERSSILLTRSKFKSFFLVLKRERKGAFFIFALIAQSVERIHGKDEVIGSIPIKSSILLMTLGYLCSAAKTEFASWQKQSLNAQNRT
jgi:hypothetical protein